MHFAWPIVKSFEIKEKEKRIKLEPVEKSRLFKISEKISRCGFLNHFRNIAESNFEHVKKTAAAQVNMGKVHIWSTHVLVDNGFSFLFSQCSSCQSPTKITEIGAFVKTHTEN